MTFTYWRYNLAGNRLINRYMPEAFMADMRHPGNRLSEDARFHYQYDQYGNLSQKISKRDAGEVHHYRYDRSHRLVSYLCAQDGEALRGGRYCYDPLGRRIGKQLMQRDQPKHISWFGWDGDKLVLTERDGTRIHTVYLPRSFVPLLRFEGDKPPTVTPLADKLEQEAGITLPPDFKHTLHHIEQALRANRLSAEQHAWLNQVQLSPEYLASLLDPLPDTPYAAQLYDCNHLGTPQQLINLNGHIDWSITLDAWGNALSEENPHQLHQPIRMQGQQYDEESGLHYNRHRYYDPTIGRYITQDPIGLDGGLNLYTYPLNTVTNIDPLGLSTMIIGNGPVPDNPFGHGAAANRYGLMSSGTGDKVGSSVTDYFKKMQPRRDSWIWIVDTTDEQEKCMINKAKDIEKSQEKLGIALDNCFSRTNQIFEACGYSNPVMNTNSPISIQVLGELYGSHKYVFEKGPFTKLPFEFQVEGK